MKQKPAPAAHDVHQLITNRWSPYEFDANRDVSTDDLLAIFEAARWAPSSYNEQPWRYIVVRRSEGALFEQVLSCLVEGNQAWARFAPVLALGLVSERFKRNDKQNAHAEHDLGLASATLSLEATARGLHVHQMAGIHPEKAREVFDLPDGIHALTGLAIGYAGHNPDLDDDIRKRDGGVRSRNPLEAFVLQQGDGTPASWVRS